MIKAILEALCKKNDSYYYQVRNRLNNEIYNVFLTINDRIVITPYEHLVEVWTNKHPSENDGVRIPKDALLELYIIKAEFND